MKAVNKTKGAILAERVDVAKGIRRFIGLIGRRHLPNGKGLLIVPCSGIHTYFMRFSIDALYIDEKGTVVRVLNQMPPYKVGPVDRRAKVVLELPAGTCRITGTEEGDKLEFLEGDGSEED